MKKIKIILTAIAVFTVVGGALAFKVKGLEHTWYFNNPQGKCLSSATTFVLIEDATQAPANFRATFSTNSNANAACAGIYLTDDPE